MGDNVNLIRTISPDTGFGSDLAYKNKPGDHVSISDEEVNKLRDTFRGDNTASCDSRIVTPVDDDPVYNHMPDTAFSAVGLSDPKYSLYPLVSLGNWNNGILLNDGWNVPIESLPDLYIDYVKRFGINGLRKDLKEALLRKYRLRSGDYRQFTRKGNIGWDNKKYYDVDNLVDYGLTHFMSELRDGVVDKNKYKHLLEGLRSYSTDDKNSDYYNTPSIALINVPKNRVLTARQKIFDDSAEQDAPEEYRVHEYTINGIWSPREVDNVIKKYYPGYTPGWLHYTLRNDKDEEKAKDAVSEIIKLPAEKILSDETKKNVYDNLSGILSEDAMRYIHDCMCSNNILNGVKEPW